MGKELPSPDGWKNVVGSGEQYDQDGHIEAGGLRKVGRISRVLGLAAAIVSGLVIGGYSGNDNSASGNMNDICRRVAVQDGPQHYYDGDGALVGIGASKRDRQAIQGTLDELGRGEDLDYTVYGINTLDPEQVAVIEPGIVDVCVGRNGVSVTPAPSQESLPDLEVKEATILPGTAAEFNTLLPATPEGE